jgi:signal transduction histidine kinase
MLSRLRLSAILLVLALGLALWALYAVDRAIDQRNRAEIEVDAKESAALIEGFLAAHAEALQALRGLRAEPGRIASAATFDTLAVPLRRFAPALRRVWDADSAGALLHEFRYDSTSPLRAADASPVVWSGKVAAAVARARATRQTQITGATRLKAGDSGVVIIEPFYAGDRYTGFAGATVPSAAILDHVLRRRQHQVFELRLVADGQLLASVASARPRARTNVLRDSALVQLPSGGHWLVVVGHDVGQDRELRLLLWGIGLATLLALFIALYREVRHSTRLAERSAELERLSTELLRANRAKSEFLANVSHELRTPLNAIVGFVDLLRDGVYGELAARQISPVDRIASSANHLRHLVDQVLDIAKMAAGRLEVHTELVDLRPFVLNVASEIEALVGERQLNLSLAVSRTLPKVRTDPTHLRQILLNLLGNAVKYTSTGGIALRARLVDDPSDVPASPPPQVDLHSAALRASNEPPAWVVMQVADTGIGIAQQDLGRIFEEFEQVNAGPRGDSMMRGTGLGLAISRRLARLLGGDITVESELGKGSTFTLWLPVERAAVREAAGNVARDDAERAAVRMRGAPPENENTATLDEEHHRIASSGSIPPPVVGDD